MIVGRPRLAALLAHVARRSPRQVAVWLMLLGSLGLTTPRMAHPIAGGSSGQLLFAHGAIQWLAADAATTTYTVSSLPFRPKALRFCTQGLGSATDTTSTTTHARRGVGFATSTSDRRCVGAQDQSGTGNATCTTGYRTDCVAMTLTSTPAADGLLDLNAINSDGFQLIVDDQAPVNLTVFWEAWGGDNIEAAVTIEIAEPAGTGNQDYTTGSFRPSVVMFAGCQATAAAQTAARNDSGLCVGAATGTGTTEQWVTWGNSDDASANMDTDAQTTDGLCVAMATVGGGAASATAQLTLWNSNGFRLNWTARANTGRKYIALAIQGGQWAARMMLTPTINTVGNTSTASGLPFTPIGISFACSWDTTKNAGIDDVQALGTASSTSSRRAMGHWSHDGAAAGEVFLGIEYDQCLIVPNSDGTVAWSVDLDAVLADGFRLIVDDAYSAAETYHVGYLAFASAAGPPAVTLQAVKRAGSF